MLTLQQIFNKVTAHLKNQAAPALSSSGACQYRSGDGRMCAVGCLIDPHVYSEDLEGATVYCSTVKLALVLSGVDANQSDVYDLLKELQHIHDNVSAADYRNNPEQVRNLWHHELLKLSLDVGLLFNWDTSNVST